MLNVQHYWSGGITIAHTLYKLKIWAGHINGPIVMCCAHVTWKPFILAHKQSVCTNILKCCDDASFKPEEKLHNVLKMS